MAITPERFALGMTYDEFKAQMTRNQERFEANEKRFEPTAEDLAAFKALPESENVMVLAEDWCGDVIDNLPILGRLASTSGKLNLRVFLRDQNADLMDQYLNKGEFRSIPVFAFFDGEFNELGHFIERPESITARRAQLRKDLYAAHPEFGSLDTPISQMPEDVRAQIVEAMSRWREDYKDADTQAVVDELRAIATMDGK